MDTEGLKALIVAKGDEIRVLKSKKEDVKAHIEGLLKLKSDFKALTGSEFKPPVADKKLPSKEKQVTPSKTENDDQSGERKSKSQLKKEKKLAERANAKPENKNKKTAAKANKPTKPSETAKPQDSAPAPSAAELLLRQSRYTHSIDVNGESSSQVVTPWDVEADGGVDYDKLIKTFGCSKIDQSLIDRIEKLTGHKAHRYLRRGYFFSHRDLSEILDCYERGEKFYLYTGRGPSSSSLHMGHLIPFTFTAWLQKVFDVPLVIQLTNDEKFLFKDQTLEESVILAWENAKDIIACGFDVKKTFIFANTDYIQYLYPQVLKVQKCVTYNQVRGIFGFTGSDNIGKSAFPAVQAVPSFSQTFPIPLKNAPNMRCLIPQAIDQDPYFRMTRDVAPRINMLKPALIHSKFFPALQGASSKMSASNSTATIYVSDSAEDVANKIKKYAYSGGGETKAEHEKYGANLDVDIPYQYLTFMLEDDEELEHIGKEYQSGRLMSGEVKAKLIELMTSFNANFQKVRSKISDDQIREFMRVRELEF